MSTNQLFNIIFFLNLNFQFNLLLRFIFFFLINIDNLTIILAMMLIFLLIIKNFEKLYNIQVNVENSL